MARPTAEQGTAMETGTHAHGHDPHNVVASFARQRGEPTPAELGVHRQAEIFAHVRAAAGRSAEPAWVAPRGTRFDAAGLGCATFVRIF